ncbi:Iwr1p [Saccharomyces paradoxus]|uniref:Iwr1p n=1 Tax=Saccharomyces paradoxus TaxID=27291 RepID=A0A8B8UMZ6_SACPA|nr:Iwr1 [Saccharomyces paradoxus]QHS72123.1 Iwr1 [Saccharomyces paradoxus]
MRILCRHYTILVIDEGKRVKKQRFIFKLSKTVSPESYQSEQEFSTPLLKLAHEDHRHFVLEQKKKRRRDSGDNEAQEMLAAENNTVDDDGLPPEINQMVNNYLKLNKGEEKTERKKPSRKYFSGDSAKIASLPSLDYVFDIYHLEKIHEDEVARYNNEKNIGFVKIIEHIDLALDEESDPNEARSDDEDSNDENYYQNDYPEDEDDDRSILLGSEGEDIAELEEEIVLGVNKSRFSSWNDDKILGPNGYQDVEEEYGDLFNRLGGKSDVLKSINSSNFIDLDGQEAEKEISDKEDDLGEADDMEYPRNEFFPTDADDPLAHHRDRIFYQLQKKIDRS